MLAKVNHNGSCAGYNFVKDQAVDLPEEVVVALGKDVTVLEKKVKAPKNTAMTPKQVKTK